MEIFGNKNTLDSIASLSDCQSTGGTHYKHSVKMEWSNKQFINIIFENTIENTYDLTNYATIAEAYEAVRAALYILGYVGENHPCMAVTNAGGTLYTNVCVDTANISTWTGSKWQSITGIVAMSDTVVPISGVTMLESNLPYYEHNILCRTTYGDWVAFKFPNTVATPYSTEKYGTSEAAQNAISKALFDLGFIGNNNQLIANGPKSTTATRESVYGAPSGNFYIYDGSSATPETSWVQVVYTKVYDTVVPMSGITITDADVPRYKHHIVFKDSNTAWLSFKFTDNVEIPYSTEKYGTSAEADKAVAKALYGLGFVDANHALECSGTGSGVADFPGVYGNLNGTCYRYIATGGSGWGNGSWKYVYDTVVRVSGLNPCPFPVGSVYTTIGNTNPKDLWVGTTWTPLADGQFLMNTTEDEQLNKPVAEQLPNIKSDMIEFVIGSNTKADGAFKKIWNDGGACSYNGSGEWKNGRFTFDASACSSAYTDGGKVKPFSLACRM